MNSSSILDFCSRASFATLREWHLASRHLDMLNAVERVYGSREARAWLAGKLLLEGASQGRTAHFQPNPQASIPQDT